jgi:hypothetical protein
MFVAINVISTTLTPCFKWTDPPLMDTGFVTTQPSLKVGGAEITQGGMTPPPIVPNLDAIADVPVSSLRLLGGELELSTAWRESASLHVKKSSAQDTHFFNESPNVSRVFCVDS